MSRTVHVPQELFDGRKFGFAQVVTVPTPFGIAVHVAGQVAWDADQKIHGEGDIGRQLEKALDNVEAALTSAGATLDQVGSLKLYIRQDQMKQGKAIAGALKARFGDRLPCSTWIGVTGLADERFLIEVEPSPVYLPR
jgi:enamine deaminase RidA (YjgF/YER057c/UK114 family)